MIHERGISPERGLYFVGFPRLNGRKSGIIYEAKEDVNFIQCHPGAIGLPAWELALHLDRPSVMLGVQTRYSGTIAITSISNRKSGFANPATNAIVIAGGFGWRPQNCWKTSNPA